MLSSPYKPIEHRKFFTMKDGVDPSEIPNFYASNVENWLLRDSAELVMRPGLTAAGTSPSATNLGWGTLEKKSTGLKHMVRVINGAGNTSKFQYSDNGTTWNDITGGGSKTTNKHWAMCQANEKLYAVNGTDTPVVYDGSTMTTVAAIPNGTAIEWWKNFMWVIGVAAYSDRLYFSNANDPETYGGSDYINVNLGDGSSGIGLKGHPGQTGRLYIGKKYSVWYLTGTDSTDFAIQPLTYEHGVASHESMVQFKNDVWCLDQYGNVRGLYRTTTDNPFSANRSEDLSYTISGLNKSSLDKSSAIVFDEYVMFFVPNGVDTYNSLVMVYDPQANTDDNGKSFGGWVKFTGWYVAGAVVWNQTSPQLYLHDSRTGNGRTYQWAGTSDNGLSITAKYETKIYDFGYSDRKKKFKFAYQYAPALGTVPVRIYSSVDRFYYTLMKTFNLTGTGDKLLGTTWTLGTDKLGSGGEVRQKIGMTEGGQMNHGYTLQMKLEAESSSTQVKMRKLNIYYKVLGLR